MKKKVLANHLTLNITNQCNSNCEICFNHFTKQSIEFMDLATAKKATDFFYKNLNTSFKEPFLMLFGGEPLLNYSVLSDFIVWHHNKYNKHRNIINLATNGFALDYGMIDFLFENNVLIHLSYDPIFKNFCKKRSINKIQFDHITKMLKYCISKNENLINLYYIVINENINDIEESILLMHSMGVKNIGICRELFNVWDSENINLTLDTLNRIKENHDIKLLIYPEISGTCRDCSFSGMIVYPNGEIYDICRIAAGGNLYKMGLISEDDLKVLRLGNINTDDCLRIDEIKKRKMFKNVSHPTFNLNCPTLNADVKKINYLWAK